MNIVQIYFSSAGRINRRNWWVYTIFLALVAGVLSAVFSSASGLIVAIEEVASISLNIKRWHDVGRSGWWELLNVSRAIVSIVIVLLNAALGPKSDVAVYGGGGLALIAAVLSLYAFIVLGFRKGTIGDNKFGPEPTK